MAHRFVDVALPLPLYTSFTYEIPEPHRDVLRPGMRVLVPFGRRSVTGVVVGLKDRTDVKGIRPVTDVLDAEPTYPDDILHLTRWISEYYVSPWGEALRAAAPHGLSIESSRTVHALPDVDDSAHRLGASQARVLKLVKARGAVGFSALRKSSGVRSLGSVLIALEQKGLVELRDGLTRPKAKVKTVEEVALAENAESLSASLNKRTAASFAKVKAAVSNGWCTIADLAAEAGVSARTIRSLLSKDLLVSRHREVVRDPFAGPVERPRALSLTPHQSDAVEKVVSAVRREAFEVFLLHGITGSGKTQVYIEVLKEVRSRGQGAIVLVPEISLTPQTVRRFRAHFGDEVVVMHSQLSAGERFDAWRRVRSGKAHVVIGPRSAVFAPVENLGIVVVDEEHESSYKQYDAVPRYHARDAAVLRAREAKAVVVLGSATPSLESYRNAETGKYTLLPLPDRVDDARLPTVELVDMIAERRKQFQEIKESVRGKSNPFPKKLPPRSISTVLRNEMQKRLDKGEGTILLHNRRGFAHVVACDECGYTERCANCDVTMTFHVRTKDLQCHYCGAHRPSAAVCPSCRKGELRQSSWGTQQVFDELVSLFPAARILRMDRDTTRRKGSFDRMLRSFEEGKADVLLGTQMVAKGLDFPRVTLVGVISAETQLTLPDFRSGERTFQLLTQVAGRAGRGKLTGEVVIQTIDPKHPTLLHAVGHDYGAFYKEEIGLRQEVRYPPFTRIALVEVTGADERGVEKRAGEIAAALRRSATPATEVLGPAEPAIPKLRSLFRRQVVLKNDRKKDPSARELRALLTPLVAAADGARRSRTDVQVSVDIDPQSFL